MVQPIHIASSAFRFISRLLPVVLLSLGLTGCSSGTPTADDSSNASSDQTPPEIRALQAGVNAATNPIPLYTYDIVNTYPHNRTAFTEGLFYLNGDLFESTGLAGESSLRRVDLATGNILQRVDLPEKYFGEGLATLDGKLFQLTWKAQTGFVYDLKTFQLETNFTYTGEGWGLTTDGHSLIRSDGTDQIRYFDPVTFQETKRITVLAHGQPVRYVNELEYIKGELYANVWGSDYVIRIDPATGNVLGVVDFSGLLTPDDRNQRVDVLNGIAYDPAGDRLFVTGKWWPKLFEVRLRPGTRITPVQP